MSLWFAAIIGAALLGWVAGKYHSRIEAQGHAERRAPIVELHEKATGKKFVREGFGFHYETGEKLTLITGGGYDWREVGYFQLHSDESLRENFDAFTLNREGPKPHEL